MNATARYWAILMRNIWVIICCLVSLVSLDNSFSRIVGAQSLSAWTQTSQPSGCSRTAPARAIESPGLYAPWDVARQGEHEAHYLVPAIGRWVEHQRAASVDDADALCAAVRGGRR